VVSHDTLGIHWFVARQRKTCGHYCGQMNGSLEYGNCSASHSKEYYK